MNTLTIQIILDSLEKEKTLMIHDELIKWNEVFELLHIPVYIYSPDSISYLKSISILYKSTIHYQSKSLSYFKENNYLKEKIIFGSSKQVIYPQIELKNEDEVLFISKRFSQQTMKNIFFMALDKKYEIFKKNIENLLT
ncbi:hypothetical protein [Floccifex sp.]|uniref:hypothetical protein n=1 Tax=Floccifex sp. TaxID=2815810 RepID=UPI003F08B177